MLIAKVREYLSCGLAVLACLAVAFAVITQLRNDSLQVSLDSALDSNKQLVMVNETNSNTITELVNQRELDDEIINKVFDQYETLKANSQLVHGQLEELKHNDKALMDLLSARHPVAISGLLNARVGSDKDGDSQAQTTE